MPVDSLRRLAARVGQWHWLILTLAALPVVAAQLRGGTVGIVPVAAHILEAE